VANGSPKTGATLSGVSFQEKRSQAHDQQQQGSSSTLSVSFLLYFD
jgi:hypothetical protein